MSRLKKNMICKVLGIVTMAYPKYYQHSSVDEINQIAGLWYDMLSDLEESVLLNAVQTLVATNVFPPTISEIRKAAAGFVHPPIEDASTAWGEVIAAIKRFGYMRMTEGLASLSPMTRVVVNQMGWQELCRSEEGMVDRAHFLKMYAAVVQREEQQRQLPGNIAALLATASRQIEGGGIQ